MLNLKSVRVWIKLLEFSFWNCINEFSLQKERRKRPYKRETLLEQCLETREIENWKWRAYFVFFLFFLFLHFIFSLSFVYLSNPFFLVYLSNPFFFLWNSICLCLSLNFFHFLSLYCCFVYLVLLLLLFVVSLSF